MDWRGERHELVYRCLVASLKGAFIRGGAYNTESGNLTWFFFSCPWCVIMVITLPKTFALGDKDNDSIRFHDLLKDEVQPFRGRGSRWHHELGVVGFQARQQLLNKIKCEGTNLSRNKTVSFLLTLYHIISLKYAPPPPSPSSPSLTDATVITTIARN